MKKLFLIIVAVICFGLSANADDLCSATGNVQPTISQGKSEKFANVKFHNYNNYMVNVNYTITVVDVDGEEETYSSVLVIPANDDEEVKDLPTAGGKLDVKKSRVLFSVLKCE